MKLVSVIKKIEKLTGAKIQTDSHSMEHSVEFNGYLISFYPNGRMSSDVEATCYHTRRVGAEHVTYHDNITQAFDFVARKEKRNPPPMPIAQVAEIEIPVMFINR
jgi:hypothetical protein